MDWNTKSVIALILQTDLIYLTVASLIESGIQAPIFLQEPFSRLTFSNDSGSQISCSAHGHPSPTVTWVLHDGSLVSSVPGLSPDGNLSEQATLAGLHPSTTYLVRMLAINEIERSSFTEPIVIKTREEAPIEAPQNIQVQSGGIGELIVTWQLPPKESWNGDLISYTVNCTEEKQNINYISSNDTVRKLIKVDGFATTKTTITNLRTYRRYSISVRANNGFGAGPWSSPVWCELSLHCVLTVPEPPANIKAAALTADSILVSWLPPKHRNGNILHYTVYSREAGKKGQAKSFVIRVDENGNPVTFEARNLNENQIYEFWVSASTSIGEGEPTAVFAMQCSTRAPARIASFSQIIRKSVGNSLSLECLAIGNPTPRARWFTRDRPVTFSPFYEVSPNGNLKIHSVEVSLSGNYTCSAKNLFGEDHIIYTVIAMKPPNAPQIIVHYASSDSIRISWDSSDDGGAPIQGFILSYRVIGGIWNQVDFTPENSAYTIGGLKCGTQYILKMSANNRVGEGRPSEEIIVWTKGKKSQEPEIGDLLQANSSCINLNLSAWNNGGCPISHFSIEHRSLGDTRWTVVSSDISNSDENRENLVFCDFVSATWYQLKMSAINDAGKTSAQYYFGTTNLNGDPIPKPEVFPEMDQTSIIPYVEPFDWLPYGVVGLIVLMTLLLICVILKHRGAFCGPISEGYESRTIPGDYKEDRESRRNQQVYSASPVKTVDKCNDSGNYCPIARLHSEVNMGTSLHYGPPSGFSDSREFSEAECDRERALDLEVQRVMENNDAKKIQKDELTSLLARYQEKKEQERQEYIIHV